MTERSKDTTIPRGLDEKLLRRLHQRTLERRRKRYQEASRQFLRTCKTQAEIQRAVGKASGQRVPELSKEIAEKIRELQERLRRTKKSPRPAKGHNPVRYPPFDFAQGGLLSEHNAGYLANPIALPTGPVAATGAAGGFLESAPPITSDYGAGQAQSEVGIGLFFWPGGTGTLNVTAQASLNGSWWAISPIWYFFATVFGALTVTIEDTQSGNYAFGQTDLANVTSISFETGGLTGQYSASISYPIQSTRLYQISAGAMQSVFAMPGCQAMINTGMNIDSIQWSLS